MDSSEVLEDPPPPRGEIGKKTWVSMVKDKKVLKKYEVDESVTDGKHLVEVPSEIIEQANLLWEDFVIAKFLETTPHIAKVHVILNKIWAFGDKTQKLDVYEAGMWNIEGVPMVVSKWSPEEDDSKTKLIPLWVHLTNVPMSMYSWEGLSFVTSLTGVPDHLHTETLACTNFEVAKVLVKVDLTKELPTKITYNIQEKETTMVFKYPWLPARCTKCKKWGHYDTFWSGEIERNVEAQETEKEKEEKSNEVKGVDIVYQEIKEVGKEDQEMEEGQTNAWEKVSMEKAGKSPKQTLQYGQVIIATPSRFEALSNSGKNGETIDDQEEIKEVEDIEEEIDDFSQNVTAEEMLEDALREKNRGRARQTMPRLSKTNHRIILEASDHFLLECKRFQQDNKLGRLWIVWRLTVRMTPVYKSDQIITCSVLLLGQQEEFFCSFIYVYNTVEERKKLWNDIRSHYDAPLFKGKKWMLMGDYNKILEGEKHSSFEVSPRIPLGMRDFQEVVRHCGLTDMSYQGPRFTWCNKREEGLICKKLDRVLINEEWLHSWPTYCVFESSGCSDHLRCRIQLNEEMVKKRKPFKFTNAMTKMYELLYHSTSAMFHLIKSLKALKQPLRAHSKVKLGDLPKRTREAYQDLCLKQKETLENPTIEAIRVENKANIKWQRLAELEEEFLKQCSKVHWLDVGDGNNNFFSQLNKKS
ncbi:hypothetical protein N665_0143s0008 [Sinapis alba]|nr:hypothetical protein N665_0143s0008 [Sinapis alba]